MRKLKLFLSLLMLMAFSLGNVWATLPASPTWEAQALADIADGSTIIIISNSTTATNIALPAAGAGTSNPPKKACTVTTNAGVTTITPPDGTTLQDLAWTVSKQTSSWKFYVEGSTTNCLYLTGTSSNTALRVGNGSSNNEFVMGDAGKLLKVTTGSRFVGPNDNNGTDWRTYNAEDGSNYKSAQLTFYVLKAAPSCSKEVTVEAGSTTHGTFSLSDTKVCADGDGGEITISDITPADGYAFDEITATVGTVDNENKKVTGITANTTITVLFKELQKYTVSFNTGAGNPAVSPITETTAGEGITLPAGPTPSCSANGWTFAGWAASTVGEETTTAPTLLSGKYYPTDNVTLFAVYKRTEEGGGSEIKYVQVTALSQINAGGSFIITNGTKYLPSTTTSSTVAQANMVEITAGVVTGTIVDAMKWSFSAADKDGYITITNADSKYLYATSSNTGLRVNNTSDSWKFEEYTVSEVLGFAMQEKTNSRYCAVYTDGSDWRTYTTKNATNYKTNSGRLDLYKATEVSASTTYYLSAPSCCTKHNIELALGIQHGSISADLAEACEGTEVTLTATPDEHCRFVKWDVKQGETPVAVSDNKFTMPAGDVTVSATFEEIRNTVNIINPGHGDITVTGADDLDAVLEGTELNVEVSGAGYEFTLKAYKVGDELTTVQITDGKLTMPAYGIVITADEQELVSPTILVSKDLIDFGSAVKGAAAPEAQTFTISGANLTDDLSLAWENDDAYFAWEVTEGSLAANAGIVEATVRVIVTEKAMKTAGTLMDNLIVSGGGATQKEVMVGVEVQQTYTVAWYINGAKKGEQTAVAGAALENIPDATSIENGAIAGKVFRGWATAIIEGEVDEAGAGIVATPTVMPAADKTYYAVYATEEGDAEPTLSQTLSYDTWTYSGTTTDKSTYRLFGSDSQIESAEFDLTTLAQVNVYAGTFGNLSDKSVKITDGTNTWGTFTMSTKSQDTKNEVTSEVALTGTGKIYVIPNDGDGSNSGARISKVEIYTQKPVSYTKYATSGPKKLANPTFGLAEDTYTEAQSVSITAGEGETIYYTLDGTEPTTESTPYTAAIALDSYGSYTIKAIAAKEDGSKSDVVTATYGINIPFETVTDLFTYIESGKAFLGNISVTGVVSKIVTEYSTEHSNITFNISDTGAESEAQFQSYRGVGEGIAEKVAVGDKVTITGEYTLYGTTHELKQGNVISNRVAAEVSSVVISGEATNTEYFYNDDFSFAGLVATAIYNTGYTKVVTEEANVWSATPAQVTATGNVNVTATYGGKTSDAKVVAVTKQLRTITDEQLTWTAGAATAYTVGKAYTLPTLTNELGLAVIYTSETPETATISNEEGHEGEISIVAAGSTVITASFAGNDEYAAKEVSYTLTVYAPASVVVTGDATKKAYEAGETFSFEGLGAKATYADEAVYEIPAEEIAWTPAEAPVITENTTVEVTATWQGLTSAKKDVAVTVNTHAITIETPANGTLAVKNGEEAIASGDAFAKGTVLTVEATPESANYKAGVVTVTGATLEGNTITVGTTDFTVSAVFAEKAEAGIEWSSTYGEIQLQGTEIVNSDLPSLTNPYELTITYSSDDTDVAEIDPATGKITPKAEGFTTISATFAGNEDYKAAQVSFNLTVEVVAQPEFYVIGSFNDWSEYVPVYDTWYRLENLTSGKHQLKVTTAPNWDDPSQVYGYDALTIKHAGLSKDDDGNICFTISNESFVDIDFEKDEEGVKTFTVTGGYVKPTFTVVGVEALVGYNWGDGLNAFENEMVEDPETGNYELPKEDVMLAAGDYEYQVAMNHDWRNVSNSKLTITESGIYTVTFTFDPSTGATSAVAELIEPIAVLPTMKIAGDWDVDLEDPNKWNENELEVASDNLTATYKAKDLVKGTWYHFWIIKNGVYMSGNNGFDRENLSANLTNYTSEGAYAMYFQADQDGDYTFTWTYDTNVITMTFPYKEATALDNTEAGETAVKVMKNGQLLIIKNGKTYNAQGAVVK